MASAEVMPSERESERGPRQIDECQYPFVESIPEIEELTLELTVTEAKVQDRALLPGYGSAVGQLRLGARAIESDETCRFFRLIFDRASPTLCSTSLMASIPRLQNSL